MELPTLLTNDLMFLIVLMLAVAPLFSGFAAFKIGQVFFSDTERPRNRIIRRMFSSGITITVASLYVSALAIGYLVEFVSGVALDADFGGVTFGIALLAVFLQPFFNWLALRALNGNIEKLQQVPEANEEGVDSQ